MYMAKELDAGDIISAAETPIDPDEDALTLTNRLAELGADTLSRTVQALAAGTAGRTKQDESAVTFAPMLSRELSPMDFTRPARSLHDQVRGLQPWPCAVTELSGATVKVPVPSSGAWGISRMWRMSTSLPLLRVMPDAA